jgi:nucleoside-diphosphate-sugar epimerase
MYHQIITNSEITLCGSGKLTRDFIDVRDVANVLCKSILNMNPKKDFIEIYNLGSGIGISLNDISDVFVKKGYVFKEKKLKEFNDIKYSIAENSKLIKAFGIKEFNNVLVFLEKLYPAI